jgi:centromere/kinetochore protein ZW10
MIQHKWCQELITVTESWGELDEIGLSKSCRIMKLLDLRAFELKADVHRVFNEIWKDLIEVDIDAGQIAIHSTLNGTTTDAPQPLS